MCCCFSSISESIYGSPPNFSLTISPVSKPAPMIPVLSHGIRCPSTPSPTSLIVRSLHTRKYMDKVFSIASFLASTSHETFVNENRWRWGGGAIVASVFIICPLKLFSVKVTHKNLIGTRKHKQIRAHFLNEREIFEVLLLCSVVRIE